MMDVMHRPDEHRFVVVVDGHTAYVEYEIVGDGFNIVHTIVPSEIGGRGIAGELVRVAYEYAEAQGLKRLATCSYAARWLEKHA